MARIALTGTRIRERRTVLGLKQAELARQAGVSPSYLNLIEHNRRRIGGKLLVDIARALAVEVSALTQGAEAELAEELGEAAGQNPEIGAELDRIDEFVGRFPGWAALLAAMSRNVASLERRTATLAERIAHDPFLSEALHEVLSKVTAIRSTASILVETPDLEEPWVKRFYGNLAQDSVKLTETSEALVAYLDSGGQLEQGLATPQEELEAWLDATDFHILDLEGGLPASPESLAAAAPALRSDASRAMAVSHMEQYRRDAKQMPLAAFAGAAEAEGYDPARLAGSFGADLAAVFRRLASLPRLTGRPRIGLAVCDGSGTLVLRKATDRFPLPRFGAACPLWPLYQALVRPTVPIRAVIRHASSPAQHFLSYAISQPRSPAGFGGPLVVESYMLVLPEALARIELTGSVPQTVGTSCRICPVSDCPARREPSVLSELFDTAGANGNTPRKTEKTR